MNYRINGFIPHHPQYDYALPNWELCRDCCAGEREIKDAGEKYLPRTEGQLADPRYGGKRYLSYQKRAVYFNYFAASVQSMLGLMHCEPPESVQLPPPLAAITGNFGVEGQTLEEFIRQINTNQLIGGRCGVMLESCCKSGSGNLPRVSLYSAEKILDWECSGNQQDHKLVYVLLDESGFYFNPAKKIREFQEKVRLCSLARSGEYFSLLLSPSEYSGFDFSEPIPDYAFPSIRGKRLHYIPFEFINVSNTGTDIEKPPLLPLANLCLALYRGEADYRHALFMQAQSTLFLKGFPLEDPPMMGAGNYIHTESPDASGSFLEISGAGLAEMRNAQNDLHTMARNMGMFLEESGRESGEALKTRLSVKTSLMRSAALTAGFAVESLLKEAAEWCGLSPESVQFRPNTDFTISDADAGDMEKLLNSKRAGLPLSYRSIHNWARKNEYTDLPFEAELEEIRKEKELES